jgi:hypothetical protein
MTRFSQVMILHAFRILNVSSQELDDLLEQIATGADTRRHTGRAILFETVETICAIAERPSL